MPARSARTSPSDSAWFSPKITVLTASFIAAPVPSGPRWNSRLPYASRTGRARSKSPSSPPTISVSFPLSARLTLPDTGASMTPARRSRIAVSWRRMTAGGTVELSTSTLPGLTPATPPSRARSTAATASVSASIEMITSQARAPSAGVSTDRHPSSAASASHGARRLFQTIRANPAERIARAIALPMRPVPTIPTLVIAISARLVEPARDGLDDPVDRRDGEALKGCRRRQRDVRRRDAHQGCIEAVEAPVRDQRDDLRPPAADPRVLLDREEAAGLGD